MAKVLILGLQNSPKFNQLFGSLIANLPNSRSPKSWKISLIGVSKKTFQCLHFEGHFLRYLIVYFHLVEDLEKLLQGTVVSAVWSLRSQMSREKDRKQQTIFVKIIKLLRLKWCFLKLGHYGYLFSSFTYLQYCW